MIFRISTLIHSLFFMFFCNIVGFTQNSFVREIEIDFFSFSMFFSQLEEGDGGNLSLLYSEPGVVQLQFIELNAMGAVNHAYTLTIDDDTWASSQYKKKDDFQLSSCYGPTFFENPRTALVVSNFEQEIYWSKQVGVQSIRQDFAGFTSSGKVYSSFYLEANTIYENKLGIAIFDQQNGHQEWGFHYERLDTPAPNEEQSYVTLNLESFSDNSLVVLLKNYHRDAGPSGVGSNTTGYGLLHIDEDGMIIKGIGIDENVSFYDLAVDSDDNIYLGVKIEEEGDDIFERSPVGVIIKLDKAFNVLWARKLVIDNFLSRSMKIKVKPNGNIIFSHVTFGDLPVITGEISSNGNLLWYKGYSFYAPLISIGNDNSIYFTSKKKYYQDGTFDYGFIIAKTLPSGEIEGCPQFDACMSLEDISIDFTSWEWRQEAAPFLPDLPVSVDTTSFSTVPYCGTPLPPNASFILSDTICQYECLSPDSISNRLAHHVEWHIIGSGIDTIIADTSFNWCFAEPGNYVVSQEVWLLGCVEYFEQTLEVLSDNLEVDLGVDRTICTPKPYNLSVIGSRPLIGYLWDDDSTNKGLVIDSMGTYSVTVTDGYCMGINQVNLRFLEDVIDEVPLVLPPDTLICKDFLPFILKPQSPYESEFYLNEVEIPSNEFSLSQSGRYQIMFSLEGCPIEGELTLEVSPCEIPIFIPNAFSPNEDGINDFIAPLGGEFEGLSLAVLDRWGGQLFYTTNFPFRWNGQVKGRDLSVGVYVLVFHYRNKRNGLEEVVSSEVLLLR